MNSTKLIIIRHGETLWNVEDKKQGQLNSPLTALGIKQARALAQRLSEEAFTVLYSSDLGRAYETAEYIAARTNYDDCRTARRKIGERICSSLEPSSDILLLRSLKTFSSLFIHCLFVIFQNALIVDQSSNFN
jgi:broad specificity phosphatase PhoE